MQVDLASNAKKSAQNEAMVKVSGTVQEKKARVEQLTEDKALVEAIYRRAYNSLKVKLEMAEKIYSGLKKSLARINIPEIQRILWRSKAYGAMGL